MARKRKIMLPFTGMKFNPATDKPIRYFSITDVFVRSTRPNNYKLFCNGFIVMMYTHDGFIYINPSFYECNQDYIKAFLTEYAPHFDYEICKRKLSTMHPLYIGLPETVTV